MQSSSLFGRLTRGHTQPKNARHRPAHRRLLFDHLEDRLTPSTDIFGSHGFGINGLVTTPFSGKQNSSANIVLTQSDGKIVVVGSASNALGMARLTATGVLDPTFGTGGNVTSKANGLSAVTAAALQDDGKI